MNIAARTGNDVPTLTPFGYSESNVQASPIRLSRGSLGSSTLDNSESNALAPKVADTVITVNNLQVFFIVLYPLSFVENHHDSQFGKIIAHKKSNSEKDLL
jgi:hypothetical protein